MIGNMSRTIVCDAKLNCIQDFVSHTSKFPILYYFETMSNLQKRATVVSDKELPIKKYKKITAFCSHVGWML